nr:ABC transporter ATP-binding protein [Candidatus Dactylopiibacterium carminicum]
MQQASGTVLRVSGLGKRVALADGGALDILQEISFEVAGGETVAIVGASGSGKSTLLGLLAGLDVPTAGSVELAGHDLSVLDEDARARVRGERIGFVFQSFQLLPALTALENVMMPLELVGRRDAAQLARHWLERVGLDARGRHYPRQLSGGEQQRVALARAFAVQPAILFADEPTGNLDVQTGRQIIELIFALNRESGTTLLLVTHDEALANACHRSIRLRGGRMLEAAALQD